MSDNFMMAHEQINRMIIAIGSTRTIVSYADVNGGMIMASVSKRPQQIVFMTGTGGTGKTTAVNALALRLLTRRGYRVAVFGSVMREFYALQGLKSEADYMRLSIEEKRTFEARKMPYYTGALKMFLHANKDVDVILSDRSPLDYIAYGVVTLCSGADHIAEMQLTIADALTGYPDIPIPQKIVYFPYPASWSNTAEVGDGFRDVDHVKDSAVNGVILEMLHQLGSTIPKLSLKAESLPDRLQAIEKFIDE